jgi:hypothetical protein
LIFGKLEDQDAEYRAKKEGWPDISTQAKKCTGQGQCGEESRITQGNNGKQAASAFSGSCKAPYSRE